MKVAPYGSWKSPISSDLIVQETIVLGQVVLDGMDVFWSELRPRESGRYAIMRRPSGGTNEDILPLPFNARTRVHEYGGGAFTVADGTVYFTNYSDQRVYQVRLGRGPEPVTPAVELRYADLTIDSHRGRLLCILEDHREKGREAVNSLASIDLSGSGAPEILVSGNDFYSSPSLSPDGSHLAWLTWSHPNMPWDGTELWVGELDGDGSLRQQALVAGSRHESIFQPEWSPDGDLYFVSDRSGWWNLYRRHHDTVEAIHTMEAEFGRPQWVFGLSTFAFESAKRLACSYSHRGSGHLATIGTETLEFKEVETSLTVFSPSVRASRGAVVCVAGSPSMPLSVVRIGLDDGTTETLRSSSEASIDAAYISTPQHIEFPTDAGQSSHAQFYPPYNAAYSPPESEEPPLLVFSHGGPTSATVAALDLQKQYWTSRGFAVLDVDYGGSTGYGRDYRERLKGRWGIVDVQDCINGAKDLVARGLADQERLAIRGGSAGGYTTLCALTFHDFFTAGASYFGVSDCEALARDTHKFESRYLDSLIGPYPEARELYHDRSPIHFVDRLSCPIILFQGLEDRVVPPSQAEIMLEALRSRGLPVAYIPFEGEQHGFRRAENIKRALESEYYFYSQVFGFEPADEVEPVHIWNM